MVERGFEVAANRFKLLADLPLKLQVETIVSLQQSSVIHDYLQWKRSISASDFSVMEQRTTKLVGSWRKHLSYQPMDLIGSDYISANRDCFASKVGISLEELEVRDTTTDALLSSLQELRVDQDIWLANLGILHKNSFATLAPLKRLNDSRREELRLVEYRKTMARYLAAFSRRLEKAEWCKKWCSVWKRIGKCNLLLQLMHKT